MPFHRIAASALRLSGATACLMLLGGCGGSDQAGPPGPVAVTTLQVSSRTVPLVLEGVGRTEGSKEVEIRARVSGIVEKQMYSEGSFVRAGSPLFEIERAPFEIALAQAKAAADQAEATDEQAKREAERLTGLLRNAAVSKRTAEEAQTAARSSAAALAAARAQVREAQLNLSYTSVSAPIAGITGRALHSEGSLVTANTDSSLLTRVSQTDPLWVRFALSEAEHESLRRVNPEKSVVELVLANGDTYEARGRVNFAASTVDEKLGTVQLRAEFPNPKLQILPGQFVKVRVDAGTQDVIAVPQTAVLQGNQGRFVWTLGSDGKAMQRTVETGDWVGQDWIIRNGLNAGDTVILDNLMRLSPGAEVVAQAAASPATQSATATAAN